MLKSKTLAYFTLFVILFLSIIKISNEPDLPENSDKIVHLIMYFFCTWAFFTIGIKKYVIAAVIYGISIEFIQYFLPWRSFSFYDIIANIIGASIFYLFFRNFIKTSH